MMRQELASWPKPQTSCALPLKMTSLGVLNPPEETSITFPATDKTLSDGEAARLIVGECRWEIRKAVECRDAVAWYKSGAA